MRNIICRIFQFLFYCTRFCKQNWWEATKQIFDLRMTQDASYNRYGCSMRDNVQLSRKGGGHYGLTLRDNCGVANIVLLFQSLSRLSKQTTSPQTVIRWSCMSCRQLCSLTIRMLFTADCLRNRLPKCVKRAACQVEQETIHQWNLKNLRVFQLLLWQAVQVQMSAD